jgi:hypothetical protein
LIEFAFRARFAAPTQRCKDFSAFRATPLFALWRLFREFQFGVTGRILRDESVCHEIVCATTATMGQMKTGTETMIDIASEKRQMRALTNYCTNRRIRTQANPRLTSLRLARRDDDAEEQQPRHVKFLPVRSFVQGRGIRACRNSQNGKS